MLREHASKVLEFPFEPLHSAYTIVAIMCWQTIAAVMRTTLADGKANLSCNFTSLKRAVEYLDCTSEQQIQQKK